MTATSLLLLLLAGSLYNAQGSSADSDVERAITKRDVHDNIRKNDPKSKCRNGGIYAGGQCHCIHPHTGKTCEEFACVHGISVGRRYDPLSLIFSKPCICNEGWKGDLCEYHLTDRCGNRGEWKNNKCECIGSFFGDECQFTSRCDNGIIKHGRCICNKHFEGDYCERIICYHGYPNLKNMSLSCICPAKYKGLHCDQCSQVGPKIQPYPICTVNYIPSHARQSRKKTNQQIKYRFVIMTGAVTFLIIIAVSMCAFHIWHQRRKNPEEEAVRMAALSERTQMLADAAMHPTETEVQTTATKKERRRSLTNPFRMKRSTSAEMSVRDFSRVRTPADSKPLPSALLSPRRSLHNVALTCVRGDRTPRVKENNLSENITADQQ